MRKWIFAVVTSLLVCLSSNLWAQSNTDSSAAQSLIENWFSAMKAEQFDKAASFLAPQFMSVHTDGITRNKSEEMDLIKNLHMKDYHLTSFNFSHSGNAIVVTFKDQGKESIDNKSISSKAASRMAVLQKQNDAWVILAYANLDKIG